MARPPRSPDAARRRPSKAGDAGSKGGRAGSKGGRAGSKPIRAQPLEHRLLLTSILCLLAGGAVMVYSASSARTLLEGQGDGTAYLVKYVAYGSLGLVAMHLISRRGLEAARRVTPLLLLGSLGLLLLVL